MKAYSCRKHAAWSHLIVQMAPQPRLNVHKVVPQSSQVSAAIRLTSHSTVPMQRDPSEAVCVTLSLCAV